MLVTELLDHYKAFFCSKFPQIGEKPKSVYGISLTFYVVRGSFKMSHEQVARKVFTESTVLNLMFSCPRV